MGANSATDLRSAARSVRERRAWWYRKADGTPNADALRGNRLTLARDAIKRALECTTATNMRATLAEAHSVQQLDDEAFIAHLISCDDALAAWLEERADKLDAEAAPVQEGA